MIERFAFDGELIYWRGPSPFYFVAVPEPHRSAISDLSRQVTYGWGMIPATVTVGGSTWETSLFPREGGYLVPIKKVHRVAEGLEEGERLSVVLEVVHTRR